MSAPDERPEIAKLKADVTIPTALVQKAAPQLLSWLLSAPLQISALHHLLERLPPL